MHRFHDASKLILDIPTGFWQDSITHFSREKL